MIDCACDYGNEEQVGEAIKKCIENKVVERKDLFITSKLWNTYHKPTHVREACLRTLADLQIDYLDLYLIHFPISLAFVPFEERYPPAWVHDPKSSKPYMLEDPVPILETWRAMEQLVEEGLVRNIGVSNFNISLIRDLWAKCSIKPSVLQVEIHPYLTQKALIRFCREKGIQITAFSSLGALSYVPIFPETEKEIITKEERILKLAEKHSKTVFQIALRWAIQQGLAIIPKSSRSEKMK